MSYMLFLYNLKATSTKNVNWRNGPNKPYVVLWVKPEHKYSTEVDEKGDTCPNWEHEGCIIPFTSDNKDDDDDTMLYIDIVHSGSEENTKPLIGSTHVNLTHLVYAAGLNVDTVKTLKLKRPLGRPHGTIDFHFFINDASYHPTSSTSYYMPPTNNVTQYASPSPFYGGTYPPPGHGYALEKPKGSKLDGTGIGLAVGAVAGVLGGVALVEGLDAVEENIGDDGVEKVVGDEDAGEDGSDGDED